MILDSILFSVNILNYGLIILGLTFRQKNPLLHSRIMKTAIVIDFILVTIVELKRSAVEKAIYQNLSQWAHYHILTSSGVSACYIPLWYLGNRMIKYPSSKTRLKPIHRGLGWAAVSFRTLALIFLFIMRWTKSI